MDGCWLEDLQQEFCSWNHQPELPMPQLYMVHRRVMNLWFLLLLLLACSTFHTYNHNWPNLRHLPHNLYQIQRCRLMGEPRWIPAKQTSFVHKTHNVKLGLPMKSMTWVGWTWTHVWFNKLLVSNAAGNPQLNGVLFLVANLHYYRRN